MAESFDKKIHVGRSDAVSDFGEMGYLDGVGVELQTVKDLRIEARLTILQLAAQSGVSISSINRIEHAKNPVKRLVLSKVLHTLSQALGRQISINDIEGLTLAD